MTEKPPDQTIRRGVNEHFWNRLEQLRGERSEDGLAKFCFRHRNAYRAARDTGATIGVDFLDGLARLFDVSAHYLLTGFEPPGTYIPADVPPVADPERFFRHLQSEAAKLKISKASVSLVLSQNPDPRLGVERLLELCERAEAWRLAAETAAKGAKKKRKSSEAGASPKPRQGPSPRSR